AVVQRALARRIALAYILDPGWRRPAGKIVARRIENKCPHMLRMKNPFEIVVRGALSTALVGVDRLGKNLRSLSLNPMPRIQGNSSQDRQHQEQRLRRPER